MDRSIDVKEIIAYNLESTKWDPHFTLLAKINSKEIEN